MPPKVATRSPSLKDSSKQLHKCRPSNGVRDIPPTRVTQHILHHNRKLLFNNSPCILAMLKHTHLRRLFRRIHTCSQQPLRSNLHQRPRHNRVAPQSTTKAFTDVIRITRLGCSSGRN